MNGRSIVLWGFISTTILTGIISAAQGLGFTRIDLPYMLGSLFSANRDRAKVIGTVIHFFNGWAFAALYAAAFESWRRSSWWLGMGAGLFHAFFILAGVMRLLPSMHPRMASEERGPTPTRQLEPPGFLALNYGYRTPLTMLVAHAAYGAVLGAFYRRKTQSQ